MENPKNNKIQESYQENLPSAQDLANWKSQEKIKQQSKEAQLYGGKGGSNYEVYKLDKPIYVSEGTSNSSEVRVENQPKVPLKKQGSDWTRVRTTWANFVDGNILNQLGSNSSSWKDPPDLAKRGFKALVMCRLDKNPQFKGELKNKFKPEAFKNLASAFKEVVSEESIANNLVDRPFGQSVEDIVIERLGNLSSNKLDDLLTGGLEGLSQQEQAKKIEAFKSAIRTALQA